MLEAAGTIIDTVIEEPGGTEHAGSLGLGYRVALNGQIDVVANATTESASGISNNLRVRRHLSWGVRRHVFIIFIGAIFYSLT